MEEVRGAEGEGGKEEKGKEGGKEPRRWGLPPFWSSLRRDGGHTGMVERRGGSAGGLMIYLHPGAPVPVSR